MSRLSLPLLTVFSLVAVPAPGQEAVTLEFSFSNPGARSLGLGGAFVALADDATAAYANPAGLVQLVDPEVSAEGRGWSYTTPFTAGGRVAGTPTGLGLDTVPGVRRVDSTAEFTDLSFLSYVHPFGRWSFALYRHQLARFESSITTQGIFGPGSTFAGTNRLIDERSFTGIDIVNHGLSAGFRLNEALSLGIGLMFLDTRLEVSGRNYLWDDHSPESFFGANSYLPERLWEEVSVTGDSTNLGLILGFLWRLSERFGLGGFYRGGIEVHYGAEARLGPAHPWYPLAEAETATLSTPDVYGLGVAWRSSDGRLILSFDWDRVEYSTILESLDIEDEAIPDGDELRLGFEYVFLRSSPAVALRLGAWLDPDHRIRSLDDDDPFARAVLPPGDDELHLAAGLGLVFETFQVDLAADFSDLVDTASMSVIFAF